MAAAAAAASLHLQTLSPPPRTRTGILFFFLNFITAQLYYYIIYRTARESDRISVSWRRRKILILLTRVPVCVISITCPLFRWWNARHDSQPYYIFVHRSGGGGDVLVHSGSGSGGGDDDVVYVSGMRHTHSAHTSTLIRRVLENISAPSSYIHIRIYT